MNPDWMRWIISSINKYFSDAISPSLYLYISGTDRRTESLKDYAELRRDGPSCTELSKNYWQIDVVIDILVVNKMNVGDLYAFERNIGLVQSAFTTDFPVYMYGNSPDEMLGCFVLRPQPDEPIRTSYFDQIQNDLRLRQASVEACYRMFLTT